MIREFPPAIADVLKNELPATHQFWWVRGVVLSVAEIERATANPEKQNPGGRLRNMVLQVGDLDNPDDGYDLEIEGVSYQIEVNDVVSLLGHEEKNAEQVSYPRLLINHNTGGLITRCYPRAKSLGWGVLPMVERKYWLAAKTPANPAEKLKNFWIALAALLLPYILIGLFAGPYGPFIIFGLLALLLSPMIIGLFLAWKYMAWIEDQPRFSFESDLPRLSVVNWRAYVNFNRQDLTRLYEKLARLFHDHALENPAPDVDFVPVDRGEHTIGLLNDAPEIPVAVSEPVAPAGSAALPRAVHLG